MEKSCQNASITSALWGKSHFTFIVSLMSLVHYSRVAVFTIWAACQCVVWVPGWPYRCQYREWMNAQGEPSLLYIRNQFILDQEDLQFLLLLFSGSDFLASDCILYHLSQIHCFFFLAESKFNQGSGQKWHRKCPRYLKKCPHSEMDISQYSRLYTTGVMFLKEVSSAHQGCIYLIKNTGKTVKLWNIFTI